ncbi:MAG: VCBS repeat-containing protein [Planctomycetes bacterium]|nr:VCBS repeat-containing protein [Planctomycetota bacterium]
MSAKPLALTTLATAVAAAAALAQQTPPPIAPELRARFGFTGPVVQKVGDGIADLSVVDIDGDGRREAVVIDARRGRLVAVRVDQGEAKLQPIPTNGQIAGYAVADVHGDGVPDLLLVDARGRLTVRHPGREPERAPIDLAIAPRGLTLLTGDLDRDGKADLVVANGSQLRWLTQLGGEPKLSPVEPLDENTRDLQLADLDGDGALDLAAMTGGGKGAAMNLRLRRGRGDGSFGAWAIAGVEDLRHVFEAQLADGKPALGTIAGAAQRLTLHGWRDDAEQAALAWWPIGENPGGKALPAAVGDLDGDGDVDLVLARPDRAQLLVHEWRDGTFVVRTLPTLAGVASLAIGDVDGDGTNDLVLASPEEDAVGFCPGSAPLDRFPERLPCLDKPVAVAVAPGGGVLAIARNDKRDGQLLQLAPGKEPQKLADLGRLPADPTRLLVGDFGDADGREAAFVVPGDGLRTLTLGAARKDGKNADAAGFTKKAEEGAVLASTVDGAPALLAARDRFVRAFRLGADGGVRILAQDNGPDGLAEISLCADAPADASKAVRLYYDRKTNKLLRVVAGGAPQTVETPPFDFTQLLPHEGGALLLGPRGVLRVPFARGAGLRPLASHEAPLETSAYELARPGDFDHDGAPDVAIVDRDVPGLQIVAGGPQGLQRALAIPVFETPPRSQPGPEPRELAIGDLDGDGRQDFALIVHDRLLLYLQQP